MLSRFITPLLFCLFLFGIPIIAKSQAKQVKIDLMKLKSSLKSINVPFDSLIVFDNRNDTSNIYIYETGEYPLKTLSFDRPTDLAIKDYVQKAIKPFSKCKNVLVINISELRIPNNGVLKLKGDKVDEHLHSYYYTLSSVRFFPKYIGNLTVIRIRK